MGIPREAVVNDVKWNEEEEDESDDDDDLLGGIQADELNKFDNLCEGVTNMMALLHESMHEFLEFKDALLGHFLPPPVLLKLSLTSSKVYRSLTDMHEPINELIRMVKTFSTPWEEKSAALKKLHEDFHKKQRQLDIAIRRLSNIDAISKKIAQERKILNWEKIYCKVTSARGHGRRWKYTIESLKQKAKQGYDVLVHHVDQLEQGISEPFPDQELHTESAVPQMESIVEESELGSRAAEESGEEHFSVGSDEESIDPDETLNSAFSINQVPMQMEPPKPETKDEGQCTHLAEYDIILNVRCYCPKGVEVKELKCSVTHGAQFQKSSQLDLTDEEQAQLDLEIAKAAPPKPKGPMRRGAPPPPPEPEKPTIKKFSELRFPLPSRRVGLKEIPPTLQPLTVTVHGGPDEDILGMANIEVEDIEGCEMPEVFVLPDSEGELSVKDATLFSENRTVDAELQLAEPLPVSFPFYPLEGGRAGSELKAAGSVPLFFYYTKIYKPKQLNRAIGTGSVRELILEEIGVDIHYTTKDSLFPERADLAISPMTVDTPPPVHTGTDEEAVSLEEFDAMIAGHQREMKLMQAQYEEKLAMMEQRVFEMQEELKKKPTIVHQTPSEDKAQSQQGSPFVFKKGKRETKKVGQSQRLPKWGEGLPEDFFERLEMFQEESEANKRAIAEHFKKEERDNIEKKLLFQNKAFRGSTEDPVDALKDITLPALFMPTPGANVFNPRAHNYYHPTGSTGARLTQPPSMMNLPPLKDKMAILNLFELGRGAQNPSTLLQEYMSMRQNTYSPMKVELVPTNTADPGKARTRRSVSAGHTREVSSVTRELTFDSSKVRS